MANRRGHGVQITTLEGISRRFTRDPSQSFISMTIYVKIVRPRFEQRPNLWDTILAFRFSASQGCSRIQSHIYGRFLHIEERSNRHGEAEESRWSCSLCMERENEKVGVLDEESSKREKERKIEITQIFDPIFNIQNSV